MSSPVPYYYVALRYLASAGNYRGVITWSDFGSKQEFDEWLATQSEQEVVEEGITAERAQQLVRTTPPASYLLAALEDSTDRRTGKVIPGLLRYQLQKATFVIENAQSVS